MPGFESVDDVQRVANLLFTPAGQQFLATMGLHGELSPEDSHATILMLRLMLGKNYATFIATAFMDIAGYVYDKKHVETTDAAMQINTLKQMTNS